MTPHVTVYEYMHSEPRCIYASVYLCLTISTYQPSQNPSQGTIRKESVSTAPRMMSCPCINLSSRPRILRTFLSGSRASCSSSVGSRSSSGRPCAYSCVSVRIACVLLSACATAIASGHFASSVSLSGCRSVGGEADAGSGGMGWKCPKTSAEKRSPTPEK